MSISLSIWAEYFYKLLKSCSQMDYNKTILTIIVRAGNIMKKQLLALLSAVFIAAFACITVAGGSSAILWGDVDNDGEVSIIDATLIQRHLVDIVTLDENAQKRGTVSGGDELTIIDATLIQRWLVDIIDIFPVEKLQPTEAPTQAPTEAPTQAPTEPKDEVTKVKNNITIHFSNNKNWSKVNTYIYNSETGAPLKAWPGTGMTNYVVNDYNEKVYSMTVDVSLYDRVIFNNGTVQTTDTPLTKASSGYFIIGESNGKLLAGVYPYGQNGEGKIDTVSMTYPDGNYQKKIYIWTPEGYDPADKSKKYSVLYMCDGQNLFGQTTTLSGYEWECDETALSLMQNGGDGVIIVGIACGDTEALRNHELTPNLGTVASIAGENMSTFQNGGGKAFSDFVTDTVIPYVESNYNVNAIRGIAGSSSGGIEAFYIGMENMDRFRYVGALSPAFLLYNENVWDSYLSQKDFSGDVPRVYFFCGNSKNDPLEQAIYPGAVAMEGWLKNHGYPADRMITKTDGDAVHSEAFWALYFPEMLSWGLDL